MFNVTHKTENSLKIAYQYANVATEPRSIELSAKNQTQLLYLYVNNLETFIHESLDRLLQTANAIRENLWHHGLTDRTKSNEFWLFLSRKEKWQKTGNLRFKFESIIEFDFKGVTQFGGKTTALIADLKSCARNGLATLDHIHEINKDLYSNRKMLIQKQAS